MDHLSTFPGECISITVTLANPVPLTSATSCSLTRLNLVASYYKDRFEVDTYHVLQNPTEITSKVLKNVKGSHNFC